jgi:hypothetical protein
VERKGGLYGNLVFAVALENLYTEDAIRTYPLSTSLATTTVCRQIHAEIAALPMALNALHVVHIRSFVDIANRLPAHQLARIRILKLRAEFRSQTGLDRIAMSMVALTSFERVVVEACGWALEWRYVVPFKRAHRQMIEHCIGWAIELAFEKVDYM